MAARNINSQRTFTMVAMRIGGGGEGRIKHCVQVRAAEVDHARAAEQQEAACRAYLSSVFRQNLPIKKSERCLMHLCV